MTSDKELLAGRFEKRRQLGSGGMGSVWLARDLRLDRLVALKELVPGRGGEDLATARQRAVIEAQALARVRHPVIVPIHDLFFEGEDPWIVMEFIDAQSLESLIFQQPLPDLKVARMGLQVARGLSAAHRAQVVHRDVKPENILATEDDVIFLVDFGIARIAGTRGVTQVNRVVGTSGYLSPERITGEQPDNPAGDLWSLGVTFYYAITGRHPFRENGELNDVKTADAIRHQPPRPLGTESRLESLILSLLDKDPGRRPDADKVIEALTTILRGTRRSASAYPAASAPRDTAPADNSRRPPEGSRVPRPDSPGDRHGERRSRAPGGAGGRQPGNAERLRGGIEGVRGLISSLGLDTAIDMLLSMHEDDAASVLGGLPVHDCASLIQGITDLRPTAASRILSRMLKSHSRVRPGDVARRLPASVAATILTDMDPAEAAQIMAEMGERAASKLVKHLPGQRAIMVFGNMDSSDAAKILIHAKPATAANVLRVDGGLATAVLRHLEEPDRHELARLIAKERRNS